MAEVIPASIEHIAPIAENMREADAIEVWLSARLTPYQAMKSGFEQSVKAWTIMQDDTPIGMFGVSSVSVLGDTGVPWLLGTDQMLTIKRQFIRESARYLGEVLNLYPRLENYVHADNSASLKWLKWLDFNLSGPFSVGPEMADFYKFERALNV